MIELKNVSKEFKIGSSRRITMLGNLLNVFDKNKTTKILALKDINLNIEEHETIAIIGPNGSGKSTLLKIISGILIPTRGIVKINAQITPFLQLGIGFHPDLTARENVYLYGSILGKTRDYLSKRLYEIIRFANLERFINTRLKDFSAGMQERLAFSTAIYCEPQTLVLDEVLAVGDLEFRKKCLDIFTKFKKEGKTMIFVSHQLDLIKKFFKRCVYLKEGRIVMDGPTQKVIRLYEKSVKKS